MNRETIVEHVKARDRVIVWTASNSYNRYWIYRPGANRVDYICLFNVPEAIQNLAKEEGLNGGIWVRGLAGIAALFPVIFRDAQHPCLPCNDYHNSDDVAERMLLLAQLHQTTEPDLSHPWVQMTPEEGRYADRIINGHFAEDRNEFRAYLLELTSSSGMGA